MFAVFGAVFLLWLVSRLWFGRTSNTVKLRTGWLCLVVGLRGHGKSLFVARLVAERLSAGVPVFANFTVVGGSADRMSDWRDVILAPRGSMVVIDEASQWVGARAGSSLRPAAMWYVSQCRKLDHEVWIIAQHESQVAGGVRDQVNEIVECKLVAAGRHRAASWAPHEFRKRQAKPLWSWWYSPKGPAIKVYDTLDLIPPERSRRNSVEIDIDMIEECILMIRARDAGAPDLDAEVASWLEVAGLAE